jgi:hypothetical protein
MRPVGDAPTPLGSNASSEGNSGVRRFIRAERVAA